MRLEGIPAACDLNIDHKKFDIDLQIGEQLSTFRAILTLANTRKHPDMEALGEADPMKRIGLTGLLTKRSQSRAITSDRRDELTLPR